MDKDSSLFTTLNRMKMEQKTSRFLLRSKVSDHHFEHWPFVMTRCHPFFRMMSKRIRYLNIRSWLLLESEEWCRRAEECTCHKGMINDTIGRPPPPAVKKGQDVTEIWKQELDKVVDYIEE